MSSVLIIDDAKVRKEAFREVEKLLKKLERLEGNLDAFHREDQRIYSDWVNLTFHKKRMQVETLQSKLRELMRFHNWMVAISEQDDIARPEAILKLREEERAYKKGDAKTCLEIEKTRRLRDEYILRQIEQDFGDEPEGGCGIDEDPHEKTAQGKNGAPLRNRHDEALFQKLNGYSDKKLRQRCGSFDEALELLSQVFELVRSDLEFKLILRIWESCSNRVQEQLSKDFLRHNNTSLNSAIEEIREVVSQAENLHTDRSGENSKDDLSEHCSDEAQDFQENFMGDAKAAKPKRQTPEIIELAKLTYRKLVRILHPDVSESGQQTVWQKKTWSEVQQAYRSLDLPKLQKLMFLVSIRERRLNDLLVSEILKSTDFIQTNIRALEFEIKNLKSLPAWGFSRKKDTSVLERKIGKEIDEERRAVQDEIASLESQHEYLALIGEMGARSNRRRTNHRKRRTKQQPRHAKRKASIDPQQSFFT